MADYNINITAKDNTKKAMGSINTGLGGLATNAGKFKAAIGVAGAALAAFGVVSKITDTIDQFDDLAKSARAAGAMASNEAFEGFQVLQKAMGEAGIDAGTFDRAMLQTTTRLKAGTEGQKSFAKITDKLGDSLLDMNGNLKSGPDLLKEMMNALNAGKITTEEFAKVVGGRAGPLIQQQFASLNTTAEKLEETLTDVKAHSNIASKEAVNNAEDFNDTMGRLSEGMGQLMTDAITPLLPMLTTLAKDLLAKLPGFITDVKAAFAALQPWMSAMGAILTEVVVPILKGLFNIFVKVTSVMGPLIETAIPALKGAFQALVSIVESIVGFFQGVATSLQNIFDKAQQLKTGVTDTFSGMADSVTSKTKDMANKVTGFFDGMYQKVVGGSIVPDMVAGVLAEFQKMQTGMVQTSSAATTQVTQDFQTLGQTIEQDFLGTMESALSDGKLSLSDFSGFFSNTISSLLTDALKGGKGISNIFGSLFGGGGGSSGGGIFSSIAGLFGGGGGGGFFSGIGDFFGGFFADGGYLGAGQVGVVGENGPELISGGAGGATITPMGGAGASVNITIQAIDTQTGTQFLLDNKRQIEGIIQSAFNKRGKVGIY